MREVSVSKLPEFHGGEGAGERVEHSAHQALRVLGAIAPEGRMGTGALLTRTTSRFTSRAQEQLRCPRLRGRNQRRIDYRHVIWSLVRKPGGFARYVHRDEMFPSMTFRRGYDAIHTPHQGTKGDLEYLRILHLAATPSSYVEAALDLLFAAGEPISADAVRLSWQRQRSPNARAHRP